MSEECMKLIERLVEERTFKGITQKELAERIGLTQSQIARFESKKVTPTIETLFKITDALGCELKIVTTRPY